MYGLNELTDNIIKNFQKKIFDWWKIHKRDLPWRKTTNPYYIMISEIMLQQTQVSRSIEKYLEFIKNYPTLESLANAPVADVLKIWSGLGYNKRAIWLQQAAQQIVTLKMFPTTHEELQKLKGIGPYCSRSILIFAFNRDISTVDTNIRRILIAEGFAKETMSEKELIIIAEKLLPKGKSSDWHNALMDYGALELTSLKTGIRPLTTQSNFTKSNRYFRGKIVKLLTQEESLTKAELMVRCNLNKEKIDSLLTNLISDGLIIEKENKYQLP
ncbi:MAG: Fe-S cluster assembly protein HesB [Candidatus Heimdallarchaeota archaeon]|nr:Fe-S cluster assembly protein HesB [Candidatus Heimdallarchaeota archaeon]